MSKRPTYYVRSTGEVIGPNARGKNLGSQNVQRLHFGNLFTSRAKAERYAKIMRLVLRYVNWRKP